jgi:hypothetical protein
MADDYLMNIASILFFVCYFPEFYANYINKNANMYNVFEEIVIVIATTFALSYSVNVNNKALILNYAPLFVLDTFALFMRSYYAYKNRHLDVRIKNQNILIQDVENQMHDIENPMHDIENS